MQSANSTSRPRKLRHFRGLFYRSLFSLGVLIATALLLEMVLQSFTGIVPEKHRYLAHRLYVKNVGDVLEWMNADRIALNTSGFQFDSVRGWTGVPNVEGTNWSVDGEFHVKTNSRGFRDNERDTTKPPGTIRIAIVGDSFVWGHNLDQADLMPQLLELRLRERGYVVEVLNFGIGGYGTDQEYLLLEQEVMRYKPDIVALSFFYSNNFWNNHEHTSSQKAKPYYRFGDDGALVLMPLGSSSEESGPHRKGGLEEARFLGALRQVLEERSFIYNLAIRNSFVRGVAGLFGLTSSVATNRDTTLMVMQKKVTRALILKMKGRVEQEGVKFFVFMYPGYGYYYGDKAEYLQTIHFFQNELHGLDLVDFTPAFDSSTKPLYHFFSEHWNAEGTRMAAAVLSDYITTRYLTGESLNSFSDRN